MHLRTKDQPSNGDSPTQFVQRRIRPMSHARIILGTKVLNDDFLDMAVLIMQIAQGQHGLYPLRPGFANTDQNAGGKRYG